MALNYLQKRKKLVFNKISIRVKSAKSVVKNQPL